MRSNHTSSSHGALSGPASLRTRLLQPHRQLNQGTTTTNMAAHFVPPACLVRLMVMVVLSVCVRARTCLHDAAFPSNVSAFRPYNVTLSEVASDTATVGWWYGWPPQPGADLPSDNYTDSGHVDTNGTEMALTGFDVVTRVADDVYDTRTITTVDASQRSLPLTYLKQETAYVVYVYANHDEFCVRSGETVEFVTTAEYSVDGEMLSTHSEDNSRMEQRIFMIFDTNLFRNIQSGLQKGTRSSL
ncbi:uncharacterized protein LOC118430765 isoform X2 [Branchiostoma floridae]|uniref:Uncharacterized protein LOC118430765 isoform X2 n=1 Tax=Branchiostoma floridae TaxID=7739 RepID=A0A9J7MCW1_BRAFL|nr:uncharacterized protein LOC118430765 isoform X2 [Branchiostoma floridae]